MAKPIPKRHHTTPIMLTTNFVDSDGFLHVAWPRHPDRGVVRRRPDRALVRKHFHTIVERDGSKNVIAEKMLSNLEGRWAPIIREKIIDNINTNKFQLQHRIKLSDEELILLKLLVVAQLWRSPDYYQEIRMDEIFEDTMLQAEEHFGKSASELLEEEGISEEDIFHIKENSRIRTIISGLSAEPSASRMALQKNLSICVIQNPKKRFVSGSSPVVNNSTPKRPLDHPESCLFLPISDSVALQLMGTEIIAPGTGEGSVVSVDDLWVRKLNIGIARQSEEIVGGNRQLIESLCRNRR